MYNHAAEEIHASVGVSNERASELRKMMDEYYDQTDDGTISEFLEVVDKIVDNQREAMLMTTWFIKKISNQRAQVLVQGIITSMVASLVANSDSKTMTTVLGDVTKMVSVIVDSENDGDE